MTDPCILMCAPNGARRTKADHPAIPLTPAELADCAADVMDAGASILHLHVRDDEGRHTLDVSRYREAQAAVRDRVGQDLVIQVTSESVGQYQADEQMAMIRALRPEAVSIGLRELMPADMPIMQHRDFFYWMADAGIFYQIILYDAADLERFDQAFGAGLFDDMPPFVLFVAGRYGQEAKAPTSCLEYFAPHVADPPFRWAVCGFGEAEYEVARFAAENGGHIRVGFENNLTCQDGTPAPENSALVRQARKLATGAGRRIATAQDVREIFAPRAQKGAQKDGSE